MHATPSLACAARLVLATIVLCAGCAMRVTGQVRDASTGEPLGGVVVTADDGRNRIYATDPGGHFNLKTDWQGTQLTASAPGYRSTTVAVSGEDRYPFVTIDLPRNSPADAAARPIDAATTRTVEGQ